jgi:hypothetical protein
MERALEALQTRLEELARELKQVQSRLERLEAREESQSGEGLAEALERAAGAAERPRAATAPRQPALPVETVPLIGRTLVVLGGAYLLRALTPLDQAGSAAALGGAVAGLAYGAAWLVQADRSAGQGRRLSALFHGLAGVMIAYPLIWETTTRFGLLATPAAAAALLGFFALGLAVAWRGTLTELAWVTTLFTLITTLGLLRSTLDLMPFAVALLLLAAGVEALAFRDRWLGLRWPVALGLDLALLQMLAIAVRRGGLPEGYAALPPVGVVAVGLALPAIYLSSIAARSLLRARAVTPFEAVQAAAALLLGLGGAARVIAFHGADPRGIALFAVLLAAGCYAAAFTAIDRAAGRGRSFYCYTTFAGLLTLLGSHALLDDAGLALAWSALALAASWLGARFDRITLRFHAAIYLAAAAAIGGLLARAGEGLLAHATGPWHSLTPACGAVALMAAGCYGILVSVDRRRASRWFELLPHALVAALVVWTATGLAARGLAALVAAAPGPEADPAWVAAGRTAVLAVMAVGLAWAGSRWSRQELTWLVYAVLGGGGVRLLLEDLRYGRPLTLFLTLALYGVALIATPKLLRAGRAGGSNQTVPGAG